MVSTHSVTLEGLTGRLVEVEVDISSGMPGTVVVGLADTIVNEARDRVRSAVVNSGTTWPDQRVTINLAPSTLPKTGSHFDLAIAAAICVAKKIVPIDAFDGAVLLGELALDGRLRAVRGVLPATLAAAGAGVRCVVVPEANVNEATLVPDVEVIGIRSLRQLVALATGQEPPEEPPVPPLAGGADGAWRMGDPSATLDIADVAGQEDCRTAIVVAAAGGHHLSMTGPPGIGKTMFAQRLPALLPDLPDGEALEVSAVHSLAGVLPPDLPLLRRAPFIDPHHSASAVAIIGGGSRGIQPGAMSLAHRGVLFLDEAPEFASNVLDALRQPLESGRMVVSRANQTAAFPARFQLVLASNPCPCGQGGSVSEQCRCTPMMRRRYRDRVSGPIRDRIDIHRELKAPSRPELAHVVGGARSSAELATLVAEARQRQAARLTNTPWLLNSEVPGVELRKRWPLGDDARRLVDGQMRSQVLSARAADRVLALAWSVADLRGHDVPVTDDAQVAIALRRGDPLGPELRELVMAS